MDMKAIAADLVRREIARNPSPTQYDFCLISARLAVAVGKAPRTDAEFIDAAQGHARGLFGDAFAAAGYGQKSEWIDMCERALREAVAEHEAGS